MGSVYRPTIRGKDGKPKRSETYRLAYYDEHAKRRVVTGFTDKCASQEKLRQLEQQVARRSVGLPVEGDGFHRKPLAEVMDSWQAELLRLGRTAKYRREGRQVVEAVIAGCGWQTLGDISQDRLRAYLGDLTAAGKAPRTVNDARAKLGTMLAFAVQQDWLPVNPVERVRAAAVTFRPGARRAFTPAEFQRLIGVVSRKPRRAVNLVAALSGLRRSEHGRTTHHPFR